MYASRASLAPRIVAIKDTYPNLEEFFTETLGDPCCGEFGTLRRVPPWLRLGNPAQTISDNLRSAVESCYRRFFNHLNETEEVVRKEALTLLKEQLGSPTMVFCGSLGWVDTTKTMVLYPDTAAYEGLLVRSYLDIAVESHLKRLAQPLSEIRTLLDALNVKPMSEVIRRVPEIGDFKPHPHSVGVWRTALTACTHGRNNSRT